MLDGDIKTLRARYAAFRKASKLDKDSFDSRCASMAHEFADGEQIDPRHWVMAASQLLWDRGEWNEALAK